MLGKKSEERRREMIMRARERTKRNGDRKEENLANGVVQPNASSTTRARKIRPEESWCDLV